MMRRQTKKLKKNQKRQKKRLTVEVKAANIKKLHHPKGNIAAGQKAL
ncbi:MAG: hypothetical protein FWE06_10070 [Oscillospiraceae bacterium]|nr:hypothetical protein [Oscillospiraceae bacterium]